MTLFRFPAKTRDPKVGDSRHQIVEPVIGILLAGGQARRLGGGDKGCRTIAGVTILDRIVRRMRPQCDALLLNANGDLTRFAEVGLPVVPDASPDHLGPLAGVLAGLDHVAAHHPHDQLMVSVPIDIPFLPTDLVARLADKLAAEGAVIAYARSAGRAHYLTGLWNVELRHDLRRALYEKRLSRVSAFIARNAFAEVDWRIESHDPFFNVNTSEDLEEAERIQAEIDRRECSLS